MLSKTDIRFIKSLQVKKYRKQEQSFIVEGAKSVLELVASDFEVTMILGTPIFLSGITHSTAKMIPVNEKDLTGLGEFQTNNSALAIARIKPNNPLIFSDLEFGLVLDGIRDPGNLGTIIRIADWYGITKIILSEETADLYNAKVINASMGSFTRVETYYTDLKEYLSGANGPVFGAYLDGENIHQVNFGHGGLVVIGNESHGISPDLKPFISQKISIPRYGKAESLNAAIATAVICDNLRGRG